MLNTIGYSVFSSRGAGLVMAFDCAILLFPVCRNLIRIVRSSKINKYIPFDHNIYFHKVTAYAMLFWVFVHVNAHYTNFFWVEVKITPLKLQAWYVHYLTFAGVSGHIMLFIMLLMYAAARQEVRQRNFEIFWYIHNVGYFTFYILLLPRLWLFCQGNCNWSLLPIL